MSIHKRAVVLLAHGCEELEAVALIDVLRRGGVEVVVAGVDPDPIVASRGVRLCADVPFATALDEAASFDVIVLPGGRAGTDRLMSDPAVLSWLREHARAGKLLAAICAAPEVLQAAGLTQGRTLTSHPSVRERLVGGTYSEARVVEDGALLTSRAPGTAIEFAYAILERLLGPACVAQVDAGVLARPEGAHALFGSPARTG